MRIAQEEIFGPVLVGHPVRRRGRGRAIANDSHYGLHGGVFTGDPERRRIARRIRTGTFTVNGYMVNFDAPFGGFKSSGLGRESAVEGMLGCTELKEPWFPNLRLNAARSRTIGPEMDPETGDFGCNPGRIEYTATPSELIPDPAPQRGIQSCRS